MEAPQNMVAITLPTTALANAAMKNHTKEETEEEVEEVILAETIARIATLSLEVAMKIIVAVTLVNQVLENILAGHHILPHLNHPIIPHTEAALPITAHTTEMERQLQTTALDHLMAAKTGSMIVVTTPAKAGVKTVPRSQAILQAIRVLATLREEANILPPVLQSGPVSPRFAPKILLYRPRCICHRQCLHNMTTFALPMLAICRIPAPPIDQVAVPHLNKVQHRAQDDNMTSKIASPSQFRGHLHNPSRATPPSDPPITPRLSTYLLPVLSPHSPMALQTL